MLSSDWRRCPRARDECGRILARRGLRLLDRTPEHGSPYTQHRVTEILAWIDDHNARATTPAEGRRRARTPDPTRPSLRLPPRAAPGGGDPVTHFVALDDRALIRELCGEALVGRHIMTHASEGLTRAAVDAAAAALGAPGRGLGRRTSRLLDPAVRLAVTNRGVGAPTPWAAPCDEQAFPPAPTQRSRGSIDDGAVPMFDDGSSDDDGASRGPTPSGAARPGRVVGSPSNGGGARTRAVSRRARRRRAGNDASRARVRRRSPTASPRDPVVVAGLRGRIPRASRSRTASWVSRSGPTRGRRPAGVRTRRRARSGEGAAAGAAAGGAAAGGCPGRVRPRRCSAAGRGRRGFREVKTVKNGRNGFTSRERRARVSCY